MPFRKAAATSLPSFNTTFFTAIIVAAFASVVICSNSAAGTGYKPATRFGLSAPAPVVESAVGQDTTLIGLVEMFDEWNESKESDPNLIVLNAGPVKEGENVANGKKRALSIQFVPVGEATMMEH